MIKRTGHDGNVDWWALGVMIYEMLIGVTPFFNPNRNLLMKKIERGKILFPDRKKYRIDYTDETKDLIKRLLDVDKNTRLGSNGDLEEVLAHPALKKYGDNLKYLEKKKLKAPFKPSVNNDDFAKYFNSDKN